MTLTLYRHEAVGTRKLLSQSVPARSALIKIKSTLSSAELKGRSTTV